MCLCVRVRACARACVRVCVRACMCVEVILCRNSEGGIAIRYELDNPGIESRLGRDFPHSFRPALEPGQPPVQGVPGLFPGDKAAGLWLRPSTPI
jgi:hypothetical protein